jgi:lambda family phage portal protein
MQSWQSEFYVGSGFSIETPIRSTIGKTVSGVSRAWEAAETDRLNEDHWRNPISDNIDDELSADLTTIQQRCRYEAINNPLIEGAIETHATDIAGEHGPGLQMLTGRRSYDNAIEQIWGDWIESCEYKDRLHLVDLLHGWVGQLWFNGEFLVQDFFDDDGYHLIDIGCERLDFTTGYRNNTTLGIEQDQFGRPLAYWIKDVTARNRTAKARRVPASMCIHGFRRRFAGQTRGIPIMASSLPSNADLRDFDTATMDAARLAAENSTWFVATGPDVDFKPLKDGAVLDIPRRGAKVVPQGYQVSNPTPNHPGPQYVDFRQERERDVGRAGQMPLMITRADSSKHNLSSARYDGVRYGRACGRTQSWIARRALSKMLQRLVSVARLRGELRRDPPKSGTRLRWHWTRPPSNDPFKEAMAERIGMENGTISFAEACGARGNRPDIVIEQRRRDNEDLLAANLPPIIGAIPTDFDPVPMLNYIDGLDNQSDQPADQVPQ